MDVIKEFFEIIFILAITLGIFVLAYFSTRLLAKKTMAKSSNRNMQVVEKLYLGKDKEAALIKIGNEYYIAGISQNSIQFNGPLSNEVKKSLVFEEKNEVDLNNSTIISSYKMQALVILFSSKIKNIIGKMRGNPDAIEERKKEKTN